MTKSCIYKITNTLNGNIYVGSAKTFSRRKKCHLRLLRRNKHHCRHLQNAFNHYGESLFRFDVIELIPDTSQLVIREDWWIDQLKPEYNVIKQGILNHLGLKRSEETKRKISQALTGKHHTEETKQKLRNLYLGTKQSPELIEKRTKHQHKPIIQLDKNGNLIHEWKSATEADNIGGFDRKSIYRCLWGERKTYKKFIWQYKTLQTGQR